MQTTPSWCKATACAVPRRHTVQTNSLVWVNPGGSDQLTMVRRMAAHGVGLRHNSGV